MASRLGTVKRLGMSLFGVASIVGAMAAVTIAGSPAAVADTGNISGQAMPVGNLPGWNQIFADDFAGDNYPVGSFTNCTRFSCAGTPDVDWGAASDGTVDASGFCQDYPSQTLSIQGGIMNVWVHTTSSGVCEDDDLHPNVGAMTDGMYTVRFRADDIPGYKLVDLFWPVDGTSGEIDFPEDGNLGATMSAHLHEVAGEDPFLTYQSGVSSTGWNTATMQWTPDSVRFIMNGNVVGTATQYVPQNPMYLNFVVQGMMLGAPKPPADAEGNFQIAWATVYSYNPVAPTFNEDVAATPVGAGATNEVLTFGGQGFMPVSNVTFSDPDIQVDGPVTTDAAGDTLSVPVTVPADAQPGTGDVTVSDAGGSTTCSGCVTVDPGVQVSNVVNPARGGATVPVTINGSGFVPGATVTTSAPSTTVGAPSTLSDGQITVPVTVANTRHLGPYNLTVTNPDGGADTCTGCLIVGTLPSAPTAVEGAAGDGTASVSFNPPSQDGDLPLTGYTVTANDLTNPANGGQVVSGTSSPIAVSGLTDGDSYTFSVAASNALGTGPAATSSKVKPQGLPSPPTVDGVVAGNEQAQVQFSPPSATGGNPVISYTVTAADTTNPANGGQTATGKSSPITVSGLTNGDTYELTAVATTRAGSSPSSAASSPVVPATTPGAPTSVVATPSDGQASVSFTPPASDGGYPISSYSVTANDTTNPANGGQAVTGPGSPIVVTGLTDGDYYTFTVVAANSLGNGSQGRSASVRPLGLPGAPTGVGAAPGNGKASVSFTAPSWTGGANVTSYTVTATDTTNPANGGQTLTGQSSPITVKGLTNGDSYEFTVVANNVVGAGSASAPSSAVVPATVPAAPVIGTAVAADGEATVSFTPPASDGGQAVTSYTVLAHDLTNSANGGQTAAGTGSPVTITGLIDGDTYAFTVSAANSVGAGSNSAYSNHVRPEPQTDGIAIRHKVIWADTLR
jgi:hypothetical protein